MVVKIDNTEKLIAKCKSLYDGYDYSKTVYVKSSEKVIVTCVKHGDFEKRPNHLIRGSGCPKCGRVRTRNDLDSVLLRASNVHSSKYDYSEVVYVNMSSPVIIICPTHGQFTQTLHNHISCRNGCPKCSHDKQRDRFLSRNPMKDDEVKAKVRDTNIERYGSKTFAESDIGRKILSDIVSSESVQIKTQQTNLKKYGAKTWPESEVGRKQLSIIMSNDKMLSKVRDGFMNKYGVEHYMKTDEGRAKARDNINSPERRLKLRRGMFLKYGVETGFESPEIRAKISKTIHERYGVHLIGHHRPSHEKSWRTRRKNGTFNVSKPEDTLYGLLCDKFGVDDVIRQYKSVEYPYHCDFYVRSRDLYIELNASWTHGGHWYDNTNRDDISQLEKWKAKGGKYYLDAIETWTVRDPMKLSTAKLNGLSYLVFWDSDLTDAKQWLLSI